MIESLPRILLVVPGLLAGLLLPNIGPALKTPPASAVGMGSEIFAQSVERIDRGQRLALINSSHFVHVIGPGSGGHIVSPAAGVPVLGFHLMETNGVYTTGPWNTPGSYHLTCSVHPGMTLEVVVAP